MKALVFDFDGVIADTYEFNKQLSSIVGHNVSDEDFKAHHDGNVFEKPKIQFTEESANKFFSLYLQSIEKVDSFFCVEEIKKLSERFSLYIISSSPEDAIKKFLIYNKIDFFDGIFGVNFHRSKVEKFKHLFEKYELKPEDILFITDTLGDVLEANKVNVKSIAVDFGYHEKERLEKGNPFKIVSNFNEILEILEK